MRGAKAEDRVPTKELSQRGGGDVLTEMLGTLPNTWTTTLSKAKAAA